MPRVSVLMAVHNGLPDLEEAVSSILEQTHQDFEFLIIDDASTDGSLEFLRSYKDSRIRLFENEKNIGLTRSLNMGLDKVRGDYIARMDHDDVSLPTRLAAQVQFMEQNTEVDVCGTWAKTLGLEREQTWRYPLDDAEIRSEMLFNSSLVHSSVMLRRATLEKSNIRYDSGVSRAQDYELWTRAAQKFTFANLGRVLLRYRIHPEQAGIKESEQQQSVAADVRLRQLKALGIGPSKAQLELHRRISTWEFSVNIDFIEAADQWLRILQIQNEEVGIYPVMGFRRVLGRRWWLICRSASRLGIRAGSLFRKSPLAVNAAVSFSSKAIFWMKCLRAEGLNK